MTPHQIHPGYFAGGTGIVGLLIAILKFAGNRPSQRAPSEEPPRPKRRRKRS